MQFLTHFMDRCREHFYQINVDQDLRRHWASLGQMIWDPTIDLVMNKGWWCPFLFSMMTSSNGSIFRVTGPLYGEFAVTGELPHLGQWRGALMFSLICVSINGLVNNREAGDLRRHRAHYDVTVMRAHKTTRNRGLNAINALVWVPFHPSTRLSFALM